MTRKGGYKNIKLGKNVYRQMKRRGPPDSSRSRKQSKHQKYDESRPKSQMVNREPPATDS